jgi:hyperosmotically inducible protein
MRSVGFVALLIVAGLLVCNATVAPRAIPLAALGTPPQQSATQSMQADNALSPQAEDKLVREVRHELLLLPYYGVFDDLEYRVDGRTVTLMGYVTSQHAVTKKDAENAVKHIDGVDKVINNIEVLPPSPMDDRLRMQLYRAIYGYGPLFKYANMTIPSIHIVVKNGRVILTGVVDSETDKNLAGVRAKTVPGLFEVTNNLRVVSSK